MVVQRDNIVVVQRDNIGIFGKVNAGKSSLMNLLTEQESSIVHSTPGTTTDTKTALFEMHGLGPVKLFDTAGMDEQGDLGEKKRKKAYNDLKECDLILLVINPDSCSNPEADLKTENAIISKAEEYNKQLLIVYNLFSGSKSREGIQEELNARISSLEAGLRNSQSYRKIKLKAIEPDDRQRLLDFILADFRPKNKRIELLPFIGRDEYYLLNIPMDEETPQGRYLRPQAMCEEYITRNFAFPISYRMDIRKARSRNPSHSIPEKERYLNVLNGLKDKKIKCIITDSQAIDIVNLWTPKEYNITTFSIMMINYMSRGRLKLFVEGIKAIEDIKKEDWNLKEGRRVLIAEACNHSRIAEDIGTVQIPGYIKKNYPHLIVEHSFGREFKDDEDLSMYKLVIHCGGCMIDPQKLKARLDTLISLGVPITNYGIFLAYIQGRDVLERVLKPWGIP